MKEIMTVVYKDVLKDTDRTCMANNMVFTKLWYTPMLECFMLIENIVVEEYLIIGKMWISKKIGYKAVVRFHIICTFFFMAFLYFINFLQ